MNSKALLHSLAYGHAIFLLFSLFSACSVSDSEGSGYAKWTFSGVVQGSDDSRGLEGALVEYTDADGDAATAKTDSSGAFYISELPYGTQVFTFSYTKVHQKDTTLYAPRTVNVGSTDESNSMEGHVPAIGSVIQLSPLNAKLTGEFYLTLETTEENAITKRVPVSQASLQLVHSDTSYINLKPQSFLAETDSLGKFTFKNLPADTGLVLTVAPVNYKGLRYTVSAIPLPRLKANSTIDIGRTLLVRDSLSEAETPSISSNVFDKNCHGYKGVSPQEVPFYIFEEKLSKGNIFASAKADSNEIRISTSVKNDTLYLKHDIAFPANAQITVEIVAYGKSGKRYAYTFSGDSAFTTGSGIYAVTSNAWPSNKNFNATFGINDTLWVKFSDTLAKNTDRIQWNYAKNAAQTIYANGFYANSKAWVNADTLFVQMLEKILENREQGDSVGMNVTVYAKNETYLENFTLYTELEVPSSSSAASSSSASSSSEATSSSSDATLSSSSLE